MKRWSAFKIYIWSNERCRIRIRDGWLQSSTRKTQISLKPPKRNTASRELGWLVCLCTFIQFGQKAVLKWLLCSGCRQIVITFAQVTFYCLSFNFDSIDTKARWSRQLSRTIQVRNIGPCLMIRVTELWDSIMKYTTAKKSSPFTSWSGLLVAISMYFTFRTWTTGSECARRCGYEMMVSTISRSNNGHRFG